MLDPLVGVIGFGVLVLLAVGAVIALVVWRHPVAAWLDSRFPQPSPLVSGRTRVVAAIALEVVVAGIAIAGLVFHLVRLGAGNA